ncbi:MAG: mandelate racemase/muconate lactonizing enzyme family protein [Mycobacteriales bacterium]
MKLETLETIPVVAKLPKVFHGSYYKMDRRATLVTRIRTDEGVVAEVYNGDEVETQHEIAKIMQQELWPRIVGMNPLQIQAVRAAMLPVTFDILRDRDLVIMAISAIDTALWDIVGKAAGLPLATLWGGYADRLPLIGIGGYYSDDFSELATEVEDYLELGIQGSKMKVGSASPEVDAERFRTMRRAGGSEFILMADANQGYEPEDAAAFANAVAEDGLRWFEEPVRWYNDRRWMHDIRMKTGVAVAAGQSEHSRSGARDLMVEGSIDVCNYDASWSGGPTEWLAVAGTARSFGVQMAHHEEPHLSIHLLASQPHGTYVECFHPDRDPIFWQMLANRPELDGSGYPVPEGPGFGLELDWAWIERHRVDR